MQAHPGKQEELPSEAAFEVSSRPVWGDLSQFKDEHILTKDQHKLQARKSVMQVMMAWERHRS